MKRFINFTRNTFQILLIRAAGLPCGAFGGSEKDKNRWCVKPFGHSDSCAYDVFDWFDQPGWKLRRWARGYRDVQSPTESPNR